MMSRTPLVLIVEDDENIRDMVALVLEMSGFATAVAANGAEALAKIRAGMQPDVIVLDLRMPRLSGEELARELRAKPALSSAHIVVLSGDCGAREVAEALGAQACLGKPTDADQLIEVVREAAARINGRGAQSVR